MPRSVLPVLLALALGGVAFLVLREGTSGGAGSGGAGGEGGGVEREEFETGEAQALDAPQLSGSGPRAPRREPLPEAHLPSAPPPPTLEAEVRLTVSVVEDETGVAIPAAKVWFEFPRDPCPRLPMDQHLRPNLDPALLTRTARVHAVDVEGRFQLRTDDAFGAVDVPTLDVFAMAPGRVLGVACAVSLPGSTTIRLAKGLDLRGRVTDASGKPLFGASVLLRPGASTAPAPGHAGWALSDADGRFVVQGLLPGALVLNAAHVGHFPVSNVGEDPADPRERLIVLPPAFVLRFRLRTDDGREVVNPTVQLRTSGRPPVQVLELVSLTDDQNADGRLTAGLTIPATAPSVSIEVKAEGYAPWLRAQEPVPPEGGERVLLVTLGRDGGQGSLTVLLEDDAGKRLDYSELSSRPPRIWPLDRQNLGGGVVIERREALRFPAIPVGRYRIEVFTFAYAPGTVEASVSGGAESEARLTLRPAARLRVRFVAPSPRLVRFRLMQGHEMAPAMLEKPLTEGSAPGEEQTLAADEGGVVLGGLASGNYVVEVLSDDLRPSRTPVSLREGQTEELEIRVEPR